MDLSRNHPNCDIKIRPVKFDRSVEFDRALITGQIGWKFTEITFVCLPVHSMAAWSNLVVIISKDLHPIRPVKFDWLVEFDRPLITGQIGWKFTEITFVCLPGRIGYHLSGFTPKLSGSQILSPPRSNSTGQI